MALLSTGQKAVGKKDLRIETLYSILTTHYSLDSCLRRFLDSSSSFLPFSFCLYFFCLLCQTQLLYLPYPLYLSLFCCKMSRYYELFNQKLNAFLAEKNAVTDVLDKVEKSTGVKKQYIAQGVIAFFSLYMILGHFAELICNVVGFLYPAYCS